MANDEIHPLLLSPLDKWTIVQYNITSGHLSIRV